VSQPDETRPDEPHGTDGNEDEIAPTPFDNPFFLPVVLIGFAIWLGYDGFLNERFIADHQEPSKLWVVTFNQWGAVFCVVLAAYFGRKALKERRAGRRDEPRSES
jgi:hypothetical protein